MNEREALLLILDQVDYKANNCSITDMIGAVLPVEVIDKCRDALNEQLGESGYEQVLPNAKKCLTCGRLTWHKPAPLDKDGE